MSDPENFLTRWSRLKREGGAPDEGDLPAKDVAPSERNEIADGAAAPAEGAAPDPNAPPAFDLASLPSIELITATTDIRPFLASGVPAALTRAALRRAWTSDPKIRDFIEMAENQWDFANPDSVPGFATFRPGEDVARFVAEVEGKLEQMSQNPPVASPDPDVAPEPGLETSRIAQTGDQQPHKQVLPPGPTEIEAPPQAEPAPSTIVVQHSKEDIASQQRAARNQHSALSIRRSRGGALPQ